MRKFLYWLLSRPLRWMADRMSAAPKKANVEKSLSDLYGSKAGKKKRLTVIDTNLHEDRFIIFSDQHKGNRSGADDFSPCEKNYIAALDHYNSNAYTFISLGDSEELWKFKAPEIITANAMALKAEAAFQPKRYYRTFGNHDIMWKNTLDVMMYLKNVFRLPMPVYEGIILRNRSGSELPNVFLTHGHQGDLMSDNNALSTWVVAHLWMPLQRYLRINVNSPSTSYGLRNAHNKMMHEWSSRQQDMILITGHTHQPVFASGKYFDHPSNNIPTVEPREMVKPSYFNSGCCCFSDGDITGIEIADGMIRLVKWYDEEVGSKRMVLEEIKLTDLFIDLQST